MIGGDMQVGSTDSMQEEQSDCGYGGECREKKKAVRGSKVDT